MIGALDYQTLDRLAAGKPSPVDVACPMCGPDQVSALNRARPVLRIWYGEAGFLRYCCARCAASGWARPEDQRFRFPPYDADFLLRQAEAEAAEALKRIERVAKARALWSRTQPISGTPAETYLRTARGYDGELPSTLRFLPPRSASQSPAMISAFGLPAEPEPGILEFLAPEAIEAVHLTLLRPDGTGKAGTHRDKLMVGITGGKPVVLAPMSDALGLMVTEGIEDALSGHRATGLGAWAAGSAIGLPKLASAVPEWVDTVTVVSDADDAGRRFSSELVSLLRRRGVHVETVEIATARGSAAA
ncbi:toprim domain-containing protein [Methylobacterium nigriterrae]|uniref:toprim domain-containing protein n=1 Tax=Methylobacterium nigriterrae TaxID=3127512 RepID=UPI003013AA54